jgi:hypothetical protein
MVVCGDCRDVVGPFYQLSGKLAGQGPLEQSGTCALHPPRPGLLTWPRFDFTRGVDLCHCCGIEPLASGSRYSVWFCDICKPMVRRLNALRRRCIIPLGRHSFHYGWLLGADDLGDPVTMHRFSEASRAAAVATDALADWYRIAVGSNLEAVDAADGAPTPVIRYWRDVAHAVNRVDRFEAMCDYLDRRGRAAIEERKGHARCRVARTGSGAGRAVGDRLRGRGGDDRRRAGRRAGPTAKAAEIDYEVFEWAPTFFRVERDGAGADNQGSFDVASVPSDHLLTGTTNTVKRSSG